MAAGESAAAPERLDVPVRQHGGIGQFLRGLARVDGQRPDASVDVQGGVPAGLAGLGAQVGELLKVTGEVPGERLEDRGALGEAQGAQGGSADRAGVGQRRRGVGARRPQPPPQLPAASCRTARRSRSDSPC